MSTTPLADRIRAIAEQRDSSANGWLIADAVAALEAENAELRARCEELEVRIQNALKMAGGRWAEWGDRAEWTAEILRAAPSAANEEK